jgi:uncharacterized membrane protein (UPF0127 family)
MINRHLTVLSILLLPFVVGVKEIHAADSNMCDLFFTGDICIKGIPLANTTKKRSRGLSSLDSDFHAVNGMLFSWNDSKPRAFSMHDIHFPLSIGFLSNEGILFAIEDMEANSDKYYLSMLPATDAIELPAGQFEKVGLVIGSKLILRKCRAPD